MAHKDEKRIVRIDPHLADAAKVIAAARGKHLYEILEQIIYEWINKHHPEIMDDIKDSLDL